MAAYAIVDVDIYDIEHYLAYQKALRPLLAAVGACYLVRGGEFKVFEGDYKPRRLIMVEFPSLAVMRDFYESDEYQAMKPQRLACCNSRIIGVEGL